MKYCFHFCACYVRQAAEASNVGLLLEWIVGGLLVDCCWLSEYQFKKTFFSLQILIVYYLFKFFYINSVIIWARKLYYVAAIVLFLYT